VCVARRFINAVVYVSAPCLPPRAWPLDLKLAQKYVRCQQRLFLLRISIKPVKRRSCAGRAEARPGRRRAAGVQTAETRVGDVVCLYF
jgi:hypothetical protein